MAKKDIGDARVLVLGFPQEAIAVADSRKPAALKIALGTLFAHRLAMAHMVLRHHHIAQAIEVVCKVIIPLYILRNAVDDLHHRFGLPLRCPPAAVQFSNAVGGDRKLSTHRLTPLPGSPHR